MFKTQGQKEGQEEEERFQTNKNNKKQHGMERVSQYISLKRWMLLIKE